MEDRLVENLYGFSLRNRNRRKGRRNKIHHVLHLQILVIAGRTLTPP